MYQLVINSIVSGATYTLIGVGFAFGYRLVRFYNFGHGIGFALGGYLLFLFRQQLDLPWPFAIALALFGSAAFGGFLERLIYGPLRKRRPGSLGPLMASLGVYVASQNVISLAWGDASRSINAGTYRTLEAYGATVTTLQAIAVVVSFAGVAGLWILLRATRLGLRLRAIASNAELARALSVHTDHTLVWASFAASALVGTAGMLSGLDVGLRPTMGMSALMVGIVVMVVGGVESVVGVAAGAFLLALAQNLSVWFLGGTSQEAVAFLVLLLFLVARPTGAAGRRKPQYAI